MVHLWTRCGGCLQGYGEWFLNKLCQAQISRSRYLLLSSQISALQSIVGQRFRLHKLFRIGAKDDTLMCGKRFSGWPVKSIHSSLSGNCADRRHGIYCEDAKKPRVFDSLYNLQSPAPLERVYVPQGHTVILTILFYIYDTYSYVFENSNLMSI